MPGENEAVLAERVAQLEAALKDCERHTAEQIATYIDGFQTHTNTWPRGLSKLVREGAWRRE